MELPGCCNIVDAPELASTREMVGRRVEKKIVVEGGGCLMKHKSEANKYFLSSFYICRVLSFFKKTDLFET